MIRKVPLSDIGVDRNELPLNGDTLNLIKHIEAGGGVPPIKVAKNHTTGPTWKLLDGRHRFVAAKMCGWTHLWVSVSSCWDDAKEDECEALYTGTSCI
jgi:hypothetical protein